MAKLNSCDAGNSAQYEKRATVLALREEIIEAQKSRADQMKWKLILVAALGVSGLGLARENVVEDAEYILAFIPIACIYADLLGMHYNLRIMVIHAFCRSSEIDYERFTDSARTLTPSKTRMKTLEELAGGYLPAFLKYSLRHRLPACLGRLLSPCRRRFLERFLPTFLKRFVSAFLKTRERILETKKCVSAFDLEDIALHYSSNFLSLLVVIFGGIIWFRGGHKWALEPGLVIILAGVLGILLSLWFSGKYFRRIDALETLYCEPEEIS